MAVTTTTTNDGRAAHTTHTPFSCQFSVRKTKAKAKAKQKHHFCWRRTTTAVYPLGLTTAPPPPQPFLLGLVEDEQRWGCTMQKAQSWAMKTMRWMSLVDHEHWRVTPASWVDRPSFENTTFPLGRCLFSHLVHAAPTTSRLCWVAEQLGQASL